MSKSSSGGGLFGSPRTGAVTIVDPPVRLTYARKARVAFWVVSVAAAVLSATVASHYLHPILGLLAGTAIGLVLGVATALVVVAWPVLRAVWHWADAIVTGLLLVYGWTALMSATNLAVSLVVVGVLVGVPALVPAVRRQTAAWVWCAVVRHRLRMSFARMLRGRSQNQSSGLPLILLARPTPAGERVWVWLRPGLSMPAVEAELAQLAVNCLAAQVRVCSASRRYAAFVRVDITRRDPLRATVVSPLPGQIPRFDSAAVPVSAGLPSVGGLDLPQVPEPADRPRSGGGRPPRHTGNSNSTGSGNGNGRKPTTAPDTSADPDDPDAAFL